MGMQLHVAFDSPIRLAARGSPTEVHPRANVALGFKSFCLLPRQRLLLEDLRPLAVGSRALDILIMLIRRSGEIVSRQELMSEVWPDTVVIEANLNVQIATLRRALHDGEDGNRFIVTAHGRGYCFVCPISNRRLEWGVPKASQG